MNGHIKRKERNRKKVMGWLQSFKKDAKQTNTLSARYYKDGSEILIDQSDLGLRPRNSLPQNVQDYKAFLKIYNRHGSMCKHTGSLEIL